MSIDDSHLNLPETENRFFDKMRDRIINPSDAALELVQQELIKEKKSRNEERFYWIVAVTLLFDIFEFQHFQTWSASIIVGIIEIISMITFGRWLGVEHIWTITEKIIEKWSGTFGKS